MTREEHQELVSVIRGVHEKLRLDYQTNGDGDQVWRDHCEDVETRSKYAASMLQLATTIWPYKDRIEWCHHAMREYFFGGGLERSLQRHYRKMSLQCPESILKQAREDLGLEEEKVRLLDVGSCYNPFSTYTDIDALAIDLTPATEDVIECDFLKLNITPRGADNLAGSLRTPLEALPESSFQAVVFCLVLEYLPSCTQRWCFCQSSTSVLETFSEHPDLLTTIPPASNIGTRCQSYTVDKVDESLADFAKLQTKSVYGSGIEAEDDSMAQLMYIPQDSRDYVALFTKNTVEERTSAEDISLKDWFLELPDLDDT
ncbi:hypothetical protein HPB52_020637 [Rhipicephalus sanguineus]|uniref:Uncharacterized protein n=1 Tax=Rhipicephalus sanguineus TaxID=34632 RepID=A0A9D4PFL9_RHISA|nr:hypothetical protein HPB52_020637 [Rhipicephalus sanguineus]